MSEQEQLQQTIAALEAQRPILGDAVVDASVAALKAQLSALEPTSEPEQQRKLVTLLFCDVAGSTTMVRDLDPEDNLAIMDTGLKRLSAHVPTFGGRVTRYMGDGFKALFGHPVARENDPEMAIRAGLAILQEAQAYAAEVERRFGVEGYTVRVGVNTGHVIIGGQSEGEDTVMGAAVNLAARMESAAQPGTLLISHDTYQHVRGVFDLEPREPVTAKGFAQPVAVYRVLAAKERAFRSRRRGVEGIETRMVGRDAELKTLQDLYHTVVEDQDRQMATIVGEPGLGKSRLLYEFENWADLQPVTARLYRGRARQDTRSLPYGLIRDLLAFRLGIHDDDAAQMVWTKVEAGFTEVFGLGELTEMKAHVFGQLVGYDFHTSRHVQPIIDEAQQLRDRGLAYLVEYVKAVAGRGPVVFLLEDLHWADDGSLDAITRLGLALGGKPVLILSAARPELYQRRPRWFEGQSFHRRIDLHPLTKRESRWLVEEVLQKVERVPDALRELVVSSAEGNPFYVEELIKMLIEENVIVKGTEQWQVRPERLADVRVPSTLTGVLQARLDSLPEQERAVLQQASVVGRIFWDAVVHYLRNAGVVELDNDAVHRGLDNLRAREMIFHRELSAFSGTEEYIFKHALLRDVAYETVLKRLRRAYHAQVAGWLVQVSEGQNRSDEYAALIADHLDLAGREEEARRWHRRAGELAAARFSHEEALRHLSRALELTPSDDDTDRFQLLLAREAILHLQADREAQRREIDALEQLAQTRGMPAERAEVALRRSEMEEAQSNFLAAIEAADAALAWAKAAHDEGLAARGEYLWGKALFRQNHNTEAREHLTRAVALAQAAGERGVEADALRNLANVTNQIGDYAAAEVQFQQCLAISREVGDRLGEGWALNGLGITMKLRGNLAAAMMYYQQNLVIRRELGDRLGETMALSNIGLTLADEGNFSAAEAYYEQALALSRESAHRQGECLILNNMGNAVRLQGDYATGAGALLAEYRNCSRNRCAGR